MSFFGRKENPDARADEIIYDLIEANRHMLEVSTKPPDPEYCKEWREACAASRSAVRKGLKWCNKGEWKKWH